MNPTHITKPIRVSALKILMVHFGPKGACLELEGGEIFEAPWALMERYQPVPGDFVVAKAYNSYHRNSYICPQWAFDDHYGAIAPDIPSLVSVDQTIQPATAKGGAE